MCRKLFIAIFCLLLGVTAIAKDIKVSVVLNDEPLAHAFIMVNGRIKGAADSTGVCYIPKSAVNLGDTISASYVGTAPSAVVYGRAVAEAGECVIYMEASLHLDEVVVTVDPFELFNRYVKPVEIVEYQNRKFDFDLSLSGKVEHVDRALDGHLSVCYYNPVYTLYPSKILRAETFGDTTSVMRHIVYALQNAIVIAHITGKTAKSTVVTSNSPKTPFKARYLGLEGGNRIFTISFQNGSTAYQWKIYADKDSGYVTRIDAFHYMMGASRTFWESQTFYRPGTKKNRVEIASSRVHVVSDFSGTEYHLDISNVVPSQHKEKWGKHISPNIQAP